MQKTFSTTGTKITYDLLGEGFPVVLIHGFGEDRHIWDEQAKYLSSFCQLIIPDLPGSGDSFTTHENQPSQLEFYADCLYELLKAEQVTTCIMLGHSMGGYITVRFAECYSKIVSGFGLVHSTAFADSEEKKLVRKKGIDAMAEYGAYAFLKTVTPNLFGKKFKAAHPEKVEALAESGNNFSVKSLQQYYRAMMNRPDRTEVIRQAHVPVLFIIGTEDIAAPLNDVLQQTYLAPISYVTILEEAGHMGMWESVEKVNEAIATFIKETATA